MTDNYYLINHHIKFYFDIENQYIEFKGQRESLEPKESQILKYILEHHEEGIIRSEDILDNNWDFWSDKKVLQKVLSTLRKKFKQIGVTENGFIAAGSNYKINFHGVLVNTQHQEQKEKQALKSKLMQSIKTAVMWAFTGAVSLFAIIKINEKPEFTIDNIIQATAISGVSVEPDLSPDGQALAFTHKKEGSSQIYIKIEPNLDYQALTSGHFDQVPTWSPSGRKIAFQRFDGNQCEIRLIRLNEHYHQIGSDELLTNCSEHTYLSKLTWRSEDELFFTDSARLSGPYEIKKFNLKTQTLSDYYSFADSPDYRGSGHYFIVYSKSQDALYSLESPDWVVSNIKAIHSDNTSTQIRQVADVLLSIDVYKDHIIFKDLDNQLKSFSLRNPDNLITIFKNPLKPIAYPTVSANSNKIAMVSGSVYRNDIYSMDLESQSISEVISSQHRLLSPLQLNDEIVFISKQTGIYQVYSVSNNIQTQLTNFTKNKMIVHFAMSHDKKWLAVNFIDGTVVYKRHANGLTAVKSFPLMTFPAFSLNSDRILLKNLVKNSEQDGPAWKQQLVEYYLDDFSETGITIKNAAFGVYHEKGIIFASNEQAIKLFKLNGVSVLYEGPVPNNPSLFDVNDNSLFISLNAQAMEVSIDTGEAKSLPPQVKGQITVNNKNIYFKHQSLSSMVIFKGELSAN